MNGFCIWLTGIPSSGKTTIAKKLKDKIASSYGLGSAILDGDEVRENITKGLGFSEEDRLENMSRVAWMANKIITSGGIAIVAMVSPMETARTIIRTIMGTENIVMCHVDASKDIVIQRDVKGLYAKAINGEISGLTGYDAPYEAPVKPDCHIDTENCTPEEACSSILSNLCSTGRLPSEQYALYVGRWSPFHNGHKHIIDEGLKQYARVAIGVRCSKDAYTVKQRLEMIQAVYPNAYVFPMPDISSINIGRLVGYDVNRYEVSDDIAGISATEIRQLIADGNDEWKSRVPKAIIPLLDK